MLPTTIRPTQNFLFTYTLQPINEITRLFDTQFHQHSNRISQDMDAELQIHLPPPSASQTEPPPKDSKLKRKRDGKQGPQGRKKKQQQQKYHSFPTQIKQQFDSDEDIMLLKQEQPHPSTNPHLKKQPSHNNFHHQHPQIKHEQSLNYYQPKKDINRKGLALISSLILQVLQNQYQQKKIFTCGQISSKVEEQFLSKTHQNTLSEQALEKQRKTVKRRVYDSINVLIALGKIKKQKKWLMIQPNEQSAGQQIVKAKRQTLENIKKNTQNRLLLLARLKEQYQKLVLLKRRNEEMLEIKQVMAEATVSTHHGVKEHGNREFKFPLLIVYTEPNQSMRVTIERYQHHEEMDERYGEKVKVQEEQGVGDISEGHDKKLQQFGKKQTFKVRVEAQPIYVLSQLSALSFMNFKQQKRQKIHFKQEFLK